MNKRVIILTTESPETGGGVEHLVRELDKALQTRGYGVEVLHRENCLPPALRSPHSQIGRYWADVALGWHQRKKLKEIWSDDIVAVISQSTAGVCAFRPRHSGAKFFHFYHGTYRGQAEAIRPFISRLGYWKMKWWDSMVLERLAGRGKRILCVSGQVRQEVDEFFRYAGDTVLSPLETSFFHPMDQGQCRQTLGLPPQSTIGLFAGSIEPAKGFPVVQALMRAFPEIYWAVAIRGGGEIDLSGVARPLLFKDASSSVMRQLYGAADFVVCPSRYDSFSYVVVEALACGTPVIASPTGASLFFLREPPLDQLQVASSDDVAAFQFALQQFLRNPGVYRRGVHELVLPGLLGALSPENWLKHFCEVTGL